MAFPVLLQEVSVVSAKICCSCNPGNHKSLTLSRRPDGFGSGARVSVKGGELKVSALNQNWSLYGQFSAPVKRGSGQSKAEKEKQDYYVNLGYAIRNLREEFPALFYRELSFDIYRDDIVFRDPINTFAGLDHYKSIFWGLRFYGRIFFRALWVGLISV
ncbi:hypothetical protein HS088_TW08G01006 [Tripterygium wilfordii]|uniref:Uncharacterized protein n=1 Tax=Tripterygium wilfordii TaxID=458696 RepID=A0A7J7DDL7_TRIWF|nr:hypothetical protein HS088_TW08G01006 [Tripterygium wilfordii]